MKIIASISILVLYFFTFSSYANIENKKSDIQHFIETNECVNCDLSRAKLERSNHDNANLMGSLLAMANISSSQFNQANFQDANLEYVKAESIIARYCNFTNADLRKANFSHANLGGCDFTNANLNKVMFYHANLYKAKISEEQLKQVERLDCAIMPDGSMHAGAYC